MTTKCEVCHSLCYARRLRGYPDSLKMCPACYRDAKRDAANDDQPAPMTWEEVLNDEYGED